MGAILELDVGGVGSIGRTADAGKELDDGRRAVVLTLILVSLSNLNLLIETQ